MSNDRFDGSARAQPGEPVFPLRAHDPLAPDLVQRWVDQRRAAIMEAYRNGDLTDEQRELELVQCTQAEQIGWEMKTWRKGEGMPESGQGPEAAAASYLGNKKSDKQIESEELWRLRKGLAQQCQNAIGEINDAAEALTRWGFAGTRERADTAIAVLRDLDAGVRPEKGYSDLDCGKDWSDA